MEAKLTQLKPTHWKLQLLGTRHPVIFAKVHLHLHQNFLFFYFYLSVTQCTAILAVSASFEALAIGSLSRAVLESAGHGAMVTCLPFLVKAF